MAIDLQQFYYISACVIFGVLGLCIGSFLNVIVYRVPLKMNLAKPASHCPKCNHLLSWKDNIPLVSFLVLGGKCRYCKEPISPRYFLVELGNTILWLGGFFLFYKTNPVYAGVVVVALSVLLCIALCDADTMEIPYCLQIALAVCAVASIFVDGSWQEHLLGLVVGGGLFALIYYVYILIKHQEGLGFGDVILMSASGLLLGWKKVILAIFVGAFVACIAILIKNIGNNGTSEIDEENADSSSENNATSEQQDEDVPEGAFPFAPFLTVGVAVALLFGDTIVKGYMSLFM